MSVINQMLKDLDERAPESGHTPIATVTAKKNSTLTIVAITALVLLCINALGFYIWDLQARADINQSQQAQRVANTQEQNNIHVPTQQQQLPTVVTPDQQRQSTTVAAPNKAITEFAKSKPNRETNSETTNESQSEPAQENVANVLKPIKTQAVAKELTTQPNEKVRVPVLANNSKIAIQPKAKIAESDMVEPSAIVPAKMTVSRRQLTAKELVAQKLAKAEKAVNTKDITKAEQLFEDVLIVEPEHKQARKNLAALWFGRKSYQQALNLLAQGIALDRQDGELRLLKARIHLTQGQHQAAYTTLMPLAALEHEQYQVMLANIAQKIEQYSSAISAYKVLINMQPFSGRWHLGLAIVYDKNSQFDLAKNAYAQALTKTDISASSAKFAQQRLQELGE
ncbi:MSHA biogenesis protein MshN [Colwellia sp. KU-HH00111]|uniref:tetratricopeptide repeat protein n=1 Tax=Colwellia sp. KU-HH00111 TaxID=3127652 RepID=UPI003101C210